MKQIVDAVSQTTILTLLGKTHALRYRLHKKFLRLARETGYEVIAVVEDRYPRSYLTRSPEISYVPQIRPGLGHAYRQGLREGLRNHKFVAYSEPEKVDYVREIVRTVLPLMHEKADLVIPYRTSMQGYPQIQRNAERMGNDFFRSLTGRKLDVWFGPETIARGKAAEAFLSYEKLCFEGKRDSWDSHIVPIMECVIEGLRVASVRVTYKHPNEQLFVEREMNFALKRFEQLYVIAHCLLQRYRQLIRSRE